MAVVVFFSRVYGWLIISRTLISFLFHISCLLYATNALSLCQTGSHGALTHKPDDATLHPGGSLRLSCRTNISGTPVAWSFTKEGSDVSKVAYKFNAFESNFDSLFMIDSSNQFDLIATSTNNTEPYCGTYECVDNNGVRNAERATASVACKHILLYFDTALKTAWRRNHGLIYCGVHIFKKLHIITLMTTLANADRYE